MLATAAAHRHFKRNELTRHTAVPRYAVCHAVISYKSAVQLQNHSEWFRSASLSQVQSSPQHNSKASPRHSPASAASDCFPGGIRTHRSPFADIRCCPNCRGPQRKRKRCSCDSAAGDTLAILALVDTILHETSVVSKPRRNCTQVFSSRSSSGLWGLNP